MEPFTIAAAGEALRSGHVTATGLVDSAIERANELDDLVGVFVRRSFEAAREAAEESDRRFRAGEPRGLLEGIPIGVKDIIADPSGVTTAGSLVHDVRWSETEGTSTVTARLREAGAIVMGKTTTMEFALGLPDAEKPYRVPRNPWDVRRWAGGSSSGSASGVLTGMFLGAVGTDTAGSVRVPAAYCGITGFKPTFGLVPKDGVVPLGFSLDHVGPMARTAQDCAIMLTEMAGHSDRDPYSVRRPVKDYAQGFEGDLTGMRIGVDNLDRFALFGTDPDQAERFTGALQVLEAAGAEIVECEVPRYLEGVAVDATLLLSDALACHSSELRSRWHDFGLSTRILLASADVFSAVDYVQAQRVRRVIRDEVDALFASVDMVITPTGHLGAPRLAALDPGNGFSAIPSVHASYWNPVGNPTIAVPIGFSSEGTPLSMSITARHWSDATVLRAAFIYQQGTDFHFAVPEWSRSIIDDRGSRTSPRAAATVRDTGTDWTADEGELAMLNNSRALFRGLGQVLAVAATSRYVEPLGGFTLDS